MPNLDFYLQSANGTATQTGFGSLYQKASVSPWDTCQITLIDEHGKTIKQPIQLPGITNINFDFALDIDDAKQQGNDDMHIVIKGKKATRFKMTVRVWTKNDFDSMCTLLDDLGLVAPGKIRYMYGITHNMLALVGVEKMYVLKVAVAQPTPNKMWDWVFDCIQAAPVVKSKQADDGRVQFDKNARGQGKTAAGKTTPYPNGGVRPMGSK